MFGNSKLILEQLFKTMKLEAPQYRAKVNLQISFKNNKLSVSECSDSLLPITDLMESVKIDGESSPSKDMTSKIGTDESVEIQIGFNDESLGSVTIHSLFKNLKYKCVYQDSVRLCLEKEITSNKWVSATLYDFSAFSG